MQTRFSCHLLPAGYQVAHAASEVANWRYTHLCCRFEGSCIQNNNNEAGFLTALIFSIVTEQTIGESCCSVPQIHCTRAAWLFGSWLLNGFLHLVDLPSASDATAAGCEVSARSQLYWMCPALR